MNKEYKIRIDRVIQYIEENLNRKIALIDLARVSCFSEYHFHRVFKGFVGETVNDYVVRRRLERSINYLIFNPDISITEVALVNGFSSSANFSKAVRLYFGFSPSEIRNPEKVKDSKIGKIKPDIVLRSYKIAIFIHGCYWHQHKGCNLSYSDRKYSDAWKKKFKDNKVRDQRVTTQLLESGWRVAIIWECTTRKDAVFCDVVNELDDWIQSDTQFYESGYREK